MSTKPLTPVAGAATGPPAPLAPIAGAATGSATAGVCESGPHNPCGPWVISEDVTLLPPGTPGGVEVITEVGYGESAINYSKSNPATDGLKSYEQLLKEGVIKKREYIGREVLNSNHRNYIFFRPIYRLGKTLRETYYPSDFMKWDPAKKERALSEGRKQIISVLVDPEKTFTYDQMFRTATVDEENAPKIKEMLAQEKAGTLVLPLDENSNEYNDYYAKYYEEHGKPPPRPRRDRHVNLFRELKRDQRALRGSRVRLADLMRRARESGIEGEPAIVDYGSREIVVNTDLIGPEWFVHKELAFDFTFEHKYNKLKFAIRDLEAGATPFHMKGVKLKKAEIASLLAETKAEFADLLAKQRAKIAENPPFVGGRRKSRRQRRKRSTETRRRERATRRSSLKQ
jgi:hypothetical protein